MARRPSTDLSLQSPTGTPFWAAMETLVDSAIFNAPLPRGDWALLRSFYVAPRKGDSPHTKELRSRLPAIPDHIELSPTDVELVDFVLNCAKDRVLMLLGPRGAGKTSLIHHTEAVLLNSGFTLPPALLILDGNQLEKTATPAAFESRVTATLRHDLATLPACHRPAYIDALAVLECPSSGGPSERLKRAFRRLVDRLPGSDPRLVTVVFDNLDHHRTDVVDIALHIAKEVHTSTDLGVILCLRQSTRNHIVATDTARAFIHYSIRVQAPRLDSWLANVAGRILARAGDPAKLPIVRNEPLTPQHIQVAFLRLVSLLHGRRRDGSSFEFLEHVSANDTRHLARLLRRILSSSELPDAWLLDLKANEEPPLFHPLACVINGPFRYFQPSADVPNLLSMTDADGNVDFLLPHRALTLLDSSQGQVSTRSLCAWLAELRYSRASVVSCLKTLLAGHLVECSETETLENDVDDDWDFIITEAGQYYLHRLMARGDYLALVVVDVPLEHDTFYARSDDSFLARFDSLVEYGDAVQQRESLQVSMLVRDRPPSVELRKMADTLQRGGLFLDSVAAGVKEIIDRSAHSKSAALAERTQGARDKVRRWQSWVEDSKKRLREVVNRSRQALVVPAKSVERRQGDTHVKLSFNILGDDTSLTLQVTIPSGTRALAALRVEGDGLLVSGSTAIVLEGGLVDGPPRVVAAPLATVNSVGVVADDRVSIQVLEVPKAARRVGLLSADIAGGQVTVRLHTADGFGIRSSELGQCDRQALVDWAATQLEELSGMVAAGIEAEEAIRILGACLADQFLTTEGYRALAAEYELVDSLVISTPDPLVPWELLCPPPNGGELLEPLGVKWRVTRWPAAAQNAGLRATMSTTLTGPGRLATIGLPPSADAPWRHGSPTKMGDLLATAAQCEVLHVVGHWQDGAITFDGSPWKLDAGNVKAYGLPGPRYVIFSACGAAAALRSDNIAVETSLRAQCTTYAPLVTIRDVHAIELDHAVHAALNERGVAAVDDLRTLRKHVPIAQLYVRHGLMVGGQAHANSSAHS